MFQTILNKKYLFFKVDRISKLKQISLKDGAGRTRYITIRNRLQLIKNYFEFINVNC